MTSTTIVRAARAATQGLSTYLLAPGLLVLVASCSSTGDSSKPVAPDHENPIEAIPDAPIEVPDDGERVIVVEDNKIFVNGEEKATIDGSGFVRDENGKILGTISTDHDGTQSWWTFTPVEGGARYYFEVDNGRVVINWERTSIDTGWGAPTPPPLPEAMSSIDPASRNLTAEQRQRAKDARAGFKRSLK